MTKQDPQTMAAIEQAFERWSQKRSPESIARQDMMQFFPERIRQAGWGIRTE
jgi:seryl-tRNA(Sec) selenium transferase